MKPNNAPYYFTTLKWGLFMNQDQQPRVWWKGAKDNWLHLPQQLFI
jgi:hypothetical protein